MHFEQVDEQRLTLDVGLLLQISDAVNGACLTAFLSDGFGQILGGNSAGTPRTLYVLARGKDLDATEHGKSGSNRPDVIAYASPVGVDRN